MNKSASKTESTKSNRIPTVSGLSEGDSVTWRSQAGGSWKEKTGTVVEVVPAGRLPETMRTRGHSKERRHVSYVVSVQPAGRDKSHRSTKKPELYWPVVSKLVRVLFIAPVVTDEMVFDGDSASSGQHVAEGAPAYAQGDVN